MRVETDSEMSVAWLIVPLLPIIGFVLFIAGIFLAAPTAGSTAGLSFLGFLAIFEIGSFAAVIVYAIMIYKLAKRRNTHFQRQLLLYEDLLAMARDVSTKKGVDVSMQLNNL